MSLGALVLAAGESARMGKPKPLLEVAGETFLERILRTLDQLEGLDLRVAVLGHQATQVRRAVEFHGAQAITFCHVAAGRTDAAVCLKPSRSVDLAACQLVVRERGFCIHAIDGPPDWAGQVGAIPLDLSAPSRICAAKTPELAAAIAAALRS